MQCTVHRLPLEFDLLPFNSNSLLFGPTGLNCSPPVLREEDKFGQRDISVRTKGQVFGQRDMCSDKGTCVEPKIVCSTLSRLGRDPKMFRNLKTNRSKVPAKFWQARSSGFREKWLQGTSGFVDL